jgi:hypothetical protein
MERDSLLFKALLEEGMAVGMQRVLLLQGRKRFGEPDQAARELVSHIYDLEQLESLTDRLLQATSWQELLAGEKPSGEPTMEP